MPDGSKLSCVVDNVDNIYISSVGNSNLELTRKQEGLLNAQENHYLRHGDDVKETGRKARLSI